MLIIHVMRFNSAVPICHVPMTNKKETLYTEVFEWLKEQCPLLKPKNISMDFELAEMNSAQAIFGISPTGCDFHYNQAILRKIGKKGLKKTLGKNPEFKKWVYQIMALNHLPGDKIEAAFRELCSRQFPLSATAKRARESFERYWERFWLNTIGVERLSVYQAPLRTNNHCESYHSKLSSQIGLRPSFWIFIRQLNRLLEVNDINMERLSQQTPVTRERQPRVTEVKIQTLIKRLETGRPTPITPMEYVHAIAHLQTSKFKASGDVDSDSDSEVENAAEIDEDEEQNPVPNVAPPEVQNEGNNEDLLCKICLTANINAVVLPCMHTACIECAEKIKTEQKKCHICRGKIRRVMRIHLN